MQSKPRLVLLVFYCLAPAIFFTGAGLWQLKVSREIGVFNEARLVKEGLPPIEITVRVGAEDVFRRATASGEFVGGKTLLLGGRSRNGRRGYYVLSAFRSSADGAVILVDRGWFSGNIEPGEVAVGIAPGGEMEISGKLRRPLPRPRFFDENDLVAEGAVWRYVDLGDVGAALELELLPLVLALDTDIEGAVADSHDVDEHAPERDRRHFTYAIQWFLIAALFLIMCATAVRWGYFQFAVSDRDG